MRTEFSPRECAIARDERAIRSQESAGKPGNARAFARAVAEFRCPSVFMPPGSQRGEQADPFRKEPV